MNGTLIATAPGEGHKEDRGCRRPLHGGRNGSRARRPSLARELFR
jgi:hypothetical protein